MKVLVTGGAGYIGTALIEELIKKKNISQLLIYDNLSNGNRNFFIGNTSFSKERIKLIQGDLLDSRKLNKILKGVEVVYHLAANVTTPFSDQNPHLFEQVNHWGTAELVYAIEKNDVKKFIYVSSVSVYGASSLEVDIDSTLNPRTFYGISKMRGEEHVKRLGAKLDAYIIRCGNVYGYNKSVRFDAVINRFMFEANYHGRITVNGTGKQHRPFIHIDKVAMALSELITSKVSTGTYNLVERNLAIGELVEQIRALYPNLEMIFVNQHMKMRELRVKGSPELATCYNSNILLREELNQFKEAFTF